MQRLPLYIALSVALTGAASAAPELATNDAESTKLDPLVVESEAQPDPRYREIPAEVTNAKVTAGKKATRVDMAEQPRVHDGNLRQFFTRLPGVFVSELTQPGFFNLNYRGLGDPHEAEFVNVLEDGVPIASDWLGYPTAYYFPPTGRIARIDFIRGGSGLLYGPQIGPSLNLVTRQPDFGAGFGLSTEHLGGADGYYQTYNEVTYGGERVALLADFEHRQYDSPRINGDYELGSGRVVADIKATESSVFQFEYLDYQTESGEPGRLTSREYDRDRDLTKTPFNRLYIDWYGLRLRNQTRLGDRWTLYATYAHTELERLSRRSSAFVPPTPPPTSTTIDLQEFASDLLDLRVAGDVGAHSYTAGFVWYQDDSPRARLSSTDVVNARAGMPVFDQDRQSDVTSLFAEAVFRFGSWSVVPGIRFDQTSIDIDEQLLPANLSRPLIDGTFDADETLLGLGLLRELPASQQLYASASQAYRPTRFDDVADPTSNLGTANDPDPSRGLNLELGLRGTPLVGLYYDVSIYRIDFDDKIESQQVSVTDIRRVNSGDARHQGLEAAVDYDFFATRGASAGELKLHLSVALLDAEIVASRSAALIGNEPAFAPNRIVRAGLTYRSEKNLTVALTGTHVSEFFWRDANDDGGSANNPIAAVVPSFTVFDLTAEVPLGDRFTILAGVNNLFDEKYYSRVRSDGIEPAQEQLVYGGFRFKL